jgi:hypothetical protein
LIERLKKNQAYPLAITLNEKGEDGGSYKTGMKP